MSVSAADRCLCTELVSVTERSALALGRSLGRGDAPRALDEGLRGIREGLELVPLSGRIAIGIANQLPVDTEVGAGGRHYDLAIGPLQEAIVARGQVGVISVLAATDPGGMLTVPPMYMRKLAVGHVARGHIDLLAPVGDNIRAVAEAFGRKPMDITAIVLDRDRHDDLIEEIRETGARIKLIQDGDVTAAISSAIRGTNDHVAIGIGGAAEGVISAAALTCLGGEFQGQLWPVSRSQVRATADLGIEDMLHVFTGEELVRGDAIVVATGVSNGDLLRGVRYVADAARTHSIVMCTRCNRVRFVDTTHNFVRERGLEVRL
jgi:fructose-1,6-bisphosphatase II